MPQSSKPLRKPPTPLKKSKKVMGSFTGFPPFGYKNIVLRMGGDEKGFRGYP